MAYYGEDGRITLVEGVTGSVRTCDVDDDRDGGKKITATKDEEASKGCRYEVGKKVRMFAYAS